MSSRRYGEFQICAVLHIMGTNRLNVRSEASRHGNGPQARVALMRGIILYYLSIEQKLQNENWLSRSFRVR